MPKAKRDDPAELLRLAITGLDEQIAELRRMRAQLSAMIDRPSTDLVVKAAPPQKRRKLSAEAREKISAAAKARWARERKTKAKAQKAKPRTEKAKSKARSAKARSAPAKAKKSTAKKAKPKPPTPAVETKAVKAA
jgi:hypothetical protein